MIIRLFGKAGGEATRYGAIAQMGERLICIQEVGGSIPPGSTIVDRLVANKILYLMFRSRFKRNAKPGTSDLIFNNM